LLERMQASKGKERGVFAEEVALVAPTAAVPALVAALASAESDDERRALRKALAKSAQRGAGPKAFEAAMTDASFAGLPVLTRIDVLRALGDAAANVPSAPKVFDSVAGDAKDFKARFLLVPPAAALAKSGATGALTFVERALMDPAEPRLRARAAEFAAPVAGLRPKLEAAVEDPDVRVREAALLAIASAGKPDKSGVARAIARIESDPWTFVRRAAASVAARAPADTSLDARLGHAVNFEGSPLVRADLVQALGERGAKTQRVVVSERAFDSKEALEVRVRAIEALASFCDAASVDALTELALKGQAPFFEADRRLSAASTAALGRIYPQDLKMRLTPLVAEQVPGDIRDIARLAISGRMPRCGKR
jgi:hypothetical protein